MRRAFTLIEALVAIGVIAILLGILIPVLGGAKSDAGAVASLANLRSIGQTFELYLQGNRTVYPFVAPGSTVDLARRGESPFECRIDPHWYLEGLWPALVQDVAPWEAHFTTWLSPGAHRERLWPLNCGLGGGADISGAWVSYRYSNSFLALPSLWSGSSSADEGLIQPVRQSLVSHPGSKVLMYDADRAYLRTDNTSGADPKRPVLLTDGSASLRKDADAVRPVVNPLYSQSPRIYHDTPGGVTGRDF